MFTFVIITYNQENYIIEHLESIKYQINKYGQNIKINLIVSDDSSSDNTVKYIKIWIQKNRKLFCDIKVLVNKENLGIVKNYLKATSAIGTPFYKLLGGDDIYYCNNVFENCNIPVNKDLIFTPIIRFNKNGIQKTKEVEKLLYFSKKGRIKKYLKYQYPFGTPGLFYRTSLISEEGLRKYISKYSWIEDLPSIHYLFNIKSDLQYEISYVPYIMYRNSEGISNNKENIKNNEFLSEEKEIKNDTGMFSVKRGFNKDYIKNFILNMYIYVSAKIMPKNRKILKEYNNNIHRTGDYYNILQGKAADFMESTIKLN